MIKNIFKKFKNSFPNKTRDDKEKKVSNTNISKKEFETVNIKSKSIKFKGNKYDLKLINKDTQNIYNLYEISNIKIIFFENLLRNLKLDREQKILKLKHKLQNEKAIS